MKLKKLLTLTAAAVMMLTLITGCGEKEEDITDTSAEEGVELEQIDRDGNVVENEEETTSGRTKFTVGFDAEFAPYGFMDENGEYVGFDLSLAEEVCNRRGWELVKQPISWPAKDMELTSGSIDCIWNGFTMNGREDDYTWTKPYVDNSQVFVVAADSNIGSFEDLKDKNVGVQSDSSALAALTEQEDNQKNLTLAASFKSLVQFDDYNTAFMDLEGGAVDAIAMDVGVADYQLDSRGGKFIKLEELLATEQYGIGFLKGNDELKDQVQDTLIEMLEDGTFAKIAEEWGLTNSVCLEK